MKEDQLTGSRTCLISIYKKSFDANSCELFLAGTTGHDACVAFSFQERRREERELGH